MSSESQVFRSSQTITSVSALRAAIKGRTSAVYFLAFFGAAWWAWGLAGIQGIFPGETAAFFIVLALAPIILLSGGILLSRAADRLPRDTAPARKRPGRAFGLVFGLEIVIIALSIFLLNVLHHPEFRLPFVAIVVGVHFLPLARIFNVRLYYVVGVLLVLASVAVMLAVPVSTMIGIRSAWDALVGSICAVILWLTGIYAWLRGRSFLEQAQELLAVESVNDLRPTYARK
jgi:Family of unknown function (DUF7010)